MAMVLLDHSEGKIDAGRNSSGGVDILVFQEDWFGANDSAGKFFSQGVAETPVGDDFLSIDEASRSEQESAGTN